MFRTALCIIGSNTSFDEIAVHMGKSSLVNGETRFPVQLTWKQVIDWFETNNGKLMSPVKKPLDTPEHCKLQVDWMFKWYGLLTNPYLPIYYINEKWIYRVSRRQKIKVLPKSKNDTRLHKKQKNCRVEILLRQCLWEW